MKKILLLAAAQMAIALSSCTINESTGDIEISWAFWIIFVALIALVALGVGTSPTKKEEIKEKGKKLDEATDRKYNVTAQVKGIQNSFKFIVDDVDKQVIIMRPDSATKAIPYADIMGVEILEDGSVVQSKSMIRTMGGALIGDMIAGDAGMIVGGLSGDSRQIKKVSSITVVIKLRSLSEPSVSIVCFDAREHIGVKEIKTNDDSVIGIEYKEAANTATRIAQLIGVIIDENDRMQKQDNQHTGGNDAAGGRSDIEALEKLASLKEKGLISEEEFAAMKSKIIK